MCRSAARLVALDAATGAECWRVDHGGREGGTRLPPAVGLIAGGGGVHVARNDRRVHSLDAATGANLWVLDPSTDAASADHGFAVAGGEICVGSAGGRVHALDAATGARAWSYMDRPDDPLHITVSRDAVFVGRYQSGVEALRRPTA